MLKPTKTPQRSIAHKLLGAVFGLGVLLTVLFSCIQTLAEYKARLAEITQEMNEINNTLAPAISTALWGFDRQTLTSQAEGILHFDYINYVEIRGKGGFLITSGKTAAREPLTREFPLTHVYNDRSADLGSLYLEADTSKVAHAVLNDLKGIILLQFLSVSIVALFILLLFNRLVTRHIAGAAKYFRTFEVGDSASFLTLDKKRAGDEIDMLVDAFNALQEKLTLSHQKLAQSVIERDALLESLKKSESLLNQTQHLTKAGGWEYDVLAGKLTWTDEVYRIHGLTPEEYDPNDIDRGMGFFVSGDDSVLGQAFWRSVEEGVAYDLELRFRNARGEAKWVRTIGKPVRENGRIVRVFGNIVDNTESKLAEEALRVSEEKFSRLFLSSPDAVSLSELESGRLMEVNDGFQTVFGYGREEAIGRTTLELGLYVNPVDRAQMVQEVRDRGSIRNLELSGRHRSGSDLTVSLSVELIRIGGEPFLITTARDVTERKQAEEELRNSRALMKSMLDSIPDLLVVIDRQFRIMYSNFKGHDQLQLPEGTACSTCYQRFKLLDAPCEDCSAHSVFETGRPVEREMINPADGRVREVRGFPVLDASGQVMMVIEHVRDITERKRAEEELRASLEEKESLLKEVHHRVKNNLQIISSLLKLQARKVQSPEVHGFLRDTQNRIRSMALLHETLYRSGNLARVELLQYAKNVCTHVASSYASGGGKIRLLHKIADLTLDLDRAIPAGLIISELVSNAFKHAYPSGSTGEILVELQSTAEHQLVLRVSDDGIGLSVGADPQNAQSLGLLLVRSLTRQLDGRMSVSSGQGTVFEIVFPAQPL